MTATPATPAYCAIDFGTSNSAIAVPNGPGAAAGVHLVPLEAGQPTMPTAVFYAVEGLAPHEPPHLLYGRAAIAAYVEGTEGRLMRSMKSILGSTLAERSTEVGAGRSVRYLDVIGSYLRHLKACAQAQLQAPIERVVLGRPVFFVDDEPARDAAAQAALAEAAAGVGFTDVSFQYEPIAAAFDYEQGIDSEQLVLVSDIGGGTSDFSLVRVGPGRRGRLDRRSDILSSHGVHIAGTDFDRHVELRAILPTCGYGGAGPGGPGAAPREVPSGIYFDLATWHLINTCYTPQRLAELRGMRSFYADPRQHHRLMHVLRHRLGHALAAAAEAAKIGVADGRDAPIDLALIEPGLQALMREADALAAIDADLQRIVQGARDTVRQAGVAPDAVDALYFTGGSTGLRTLVQAIAQCFPAARVVRGERFASVASGLGVHARRLFAPANDTGREGS
jgi:hypothetical chaperone protein